MDNQLSFDRSLLIPIGVGIFAVLGICVILVSGRLNPTPAVVEEVPTATAFQYAFIGTEPAFTTMTLVAANIRSKRATTAVSPASPATTTPSPSMSAYCVLFALMMPRRVTSRTVPLSYSAINCTWCF